MAMLVHALESILTDDIVSGGSERYDQLKREAQTMLISEFRDVVVAFGEELTKSIAECIAETQSISKLREKSLVKFMERRMDPLPSL